MEDRGERRRRRHLGRLVERRDRQRVPESRACGAPLPDPRQGRSHRGAGERRRRAGGQPDRPHEQPHPVARGEQPIAEQRRGGLERAGQRRGGDGAEAECRIGERDVQAPLEGELRSRTDLGEEVERRRVGPHERVRPVVDHVAGGGIGEGVGAAAEERPALEEGHARAAASEADGRREAREAAAHHRDMRRPGSHPVSR